MIYHFNSIFVLALVCSQSDAFTIGGGKSPNTNQAILRTAAPASTRNPTIVTCTATKYRPKRSTRTCSTSTSLNDKWDDIEDYDEDEEDETPLWRGPPVPKDMKYSEFNLKRQYNNFTAIRSAGGPEMTNDIYARDPDSDTFWFAGKIARISDVTLEKAVARQFPLMEEHSARLRGRELFDKNGLLELWAAPGDSEMDVVYNRSSCLFIKMARANETEGADDVKNREVGFKGEIYEAGEEGFRTQRTEDGLPLKPEIEV